MCLCRRGNCMSHLKGASTKSFAPWLMTGSLMSRCDTSSHLLSTKHPTQLCGSLAALAAGVTYPDLACPAAHCTLINSSHLFVSGSGHWVIGHSLSLHRPEPISLDVRLVGGMGTALQDEYRGTADNVRRQAVNEPDMPAGCGGPALS